MKITLDTETMEVQTRAGSKAEFDLIRKGSEIEEMLSEEDREELIKFQYGVSRLLLTAVCGTAEVFFQSPKDQNLFIKIFAEDVLAQLFSRIKENNGDE